MHPISVLFRQSCRGAVVSIGEVWYHPTQVGDNSLNKNNNNPGNLNNGNNNTSFVLYMALFNKWFLAFAWNIYYKWSLGTIRSQDNTTSRT